MVPKSYSNLEKSSKASKKNSRA